MYLLYIYLIFTFCIVDWPQEDLLLPGAADSETQGPRQHGQHQGRTRYCHWGPRLCLLSLCLLTVGKLVCYSVHIWFFRWIGFLLLPKTRCSKIGWLFSECSTMQVKSVNIKRAYVWERERERDIFAGLLAKLLSKWEQCYLYKNPPSLEYCFLLWLPILLGLPSTDRKK